MITRIKTSPPSQFPPEEWGPPNTVWDERERAVFNDYVRQIEIANHHLMSIHPGKREERRAAELQCTLRIHDIRRNHPRVKLRGTVMMMLT